MTDASDAQRKKLLIVFHSRSGSTAALRDAVVAGAIEGGGDNVEHKVLHAFDADVDDVLWADALIMGTPANFGYMSGALKDFFERIYHRCLDLTVGRPYALFVKGDTDAAGAVTSVERIVAGLRWRAVLPPLVVVGEVKPTDLEQAEELGATLAAGLDAGIF
ncbi:MAG TPA: NAD(P)H-dependent oxidoreductase [Acidimicrobiales bacterium]|nr:NAD(P)H-dependent oxidoreductase [Acidimicrobiales bacterium]